MVFKTPGGGKTVLKSFVIYPTASLYSCITSAQLYNCSMLTDTNAGNNTEITVLKVKSASN